MSAGAFFASSACVLLMQAQAKDRADNLSKALTSSRQIGVAIGILMQAHKVDADGAFTLLRTTSQRLNRKLRDVADDVSYTGDLPGGIEP